MSWRREFFETFVQSVRAFAPNLEVPPIAPEKIFVLRNNDIGDLLVITPLFEALKRRFPKTEILAGVGSWNREILAGNPHVSKILEVNAPWHNKFVQPQGVVAALKYVYLSNEARVVRGEHAEIGVDVLGSGFGSLLLVFAVTREEIRESRVRWNIVGKSMSVARRCVLRNCSVARIFRKIDRRSFLDGYRHRTKASL